MRRGQGKRRVETEGSEREINEGNEFLIVKRRLQIEKKTSFNFFLFN